MYAGHIIIGFSTCTGSRSMPIAAAAAICMMHLQHVQLHLSAPQLCPASWPGQPPAPSGPCASASRPSELPRRPPRCFCPWAHSAARPRQSKRDRVPPALCPCGTVRHEPPLKYTPGPVPAPSSLHFRLRISPTDDHLCSSCLTVAVSLRHDGLAGRHCKPEYAACLSRRKKTILHDASITVMIDVCQTWVFFGVPICGMRTCLVRGDAHGERPQSLCL